MEMSIIPLNLSLKISNNEILAYVFPMHNLQLSLRMHIYIEPQTQSLYVVSHHNRYAI